MSSINDVKVLRGGGGDLRFCDDGTKALAIKRVTMREGRGQKLSKIALRHLWKTSIKKYEYDEQPLGQNIRGTPSYVRPLTNVILVSRTNFCLFVFDVSLSCSS